MALTPRAIGEWMHVGHSEEAGMRKKDFVVMTSKELRAAREQMGLTQQQAADKYELSLEGFKKYELGLRPIPGPVKLLTKFFLNNQQKK